MSDTIKNLTREAFERAKNRWLYFVEAQPKDTYWNVLKEEAVKPDKIVRWAIILDESIVNFFTDPDVAEKAKNKYYLDGRIIKLVEEQ